MKARNGGIRNEVLFASALPGNGNKIGTALGRCKLSASPPSVQPIQVREVGTRRNLLAAT